jgi:hypothetical protein
MGRLVENVRTQAGGAVVVDSSKAAPDALVLGTAENIDLRVLHVVRDPRATAYSWARRKYDPGAGRDMAQQSVLLNAVKWVQWNVAAERELLDRFPSATVRYEDFVRGPERTLERLAGDLGLPQISVRINKGVVTLPTMHTVSGNPMRFASGNVEIRADEEWMNGLGKAQRSLTAVMTLPLLRRYGYPLVERT